MNILGFGKKLKEQSATLDNSKVVTVEEVHAEFRTASDKLLADVKNFLFEQKAEKAKRLERFGFMSSTDFVESVEFLKKKEIAEIVNKYAFTHPNNKVITIDAVHTICKKYDLAHVPVSRYSGFVPEKNLKEIEAFKYPDDKFYVYQEGYGNTEVIGPFDTEAEAQKEVSKRNRPSDGNRFPRMYYIDTPLKRLTICAPKDKIRLNYGEEIEGHRIVVPDPIVLHGIEKNCYLIVTAWGDEAPDPEVVNEKMN